MFVGLMWQNMKEEEKHIYVEMANNDKIRYKNELESWEKTNEFHTNELRNRCESQIGQVNKKTIENKISSNVSCKVPDRMEVPESLDCAICMNAAKNAMIKPCRHVSCCVKCANDLNPKMCPVCRTPIEKIKGFFIA